MQKAIIPIGSDPEFFLFDTEKNMNISAHDYIPGTKQKPEKLKHGAVQLDGTAAEFNIDPAHSREEFVHNITEVLSQVRKMVPKHIAFQFKPSVVYEKTYFDTLVPNSCKELGCDPDFNAFNGGKINPVPNNKTTMRTAGGHLHFGFSDGKSDVKDMEHIKDCCALIQQVSNYFTYFETLWDKDGKRREMYGAPGAFRPKSYGVEYRSLSTAWLGNPKLWPWIYDSCQWITEAALEGRDIRGYTPWPDASIQSRNEVFNVYVHNPLPNRPNLAEYL